jgi:hypothetical protein
VGPLVEWSAPKDPEKYKLWKQHMSESRKGRKISDIGHKHMSECRIGKPKSKIHKQNISKSCKGRTPWNKGTPHKQSTKDKMSAKKKNIPLSEEHKKHLSESHKGQKPHITPESIEKNRIAHLNKKASQQTKELMSISHKGQKAWNKGQQMPEGTGDKISKKNKGKRRNESTRNKMRGENNHNWKGGVSELDRAIRALPEMYIWRYNVMKRDDFKDCFTGICGNHNLEAHHIKALSIIIQEYNIKTIEDALNCKEIWDLDNGVTMFKNSHIEHHRKYGLEILPKEYCFKKEN